jgi:hypothetical protein
MHFGLYLTCFAFKAFSDEAFHVGKAFTLSICFRGRAKSGKKSKAWDPGNLGGNKTS